MQKSRTAVAICRPWRWLKRRLRTRIEESVRLDVRSRASRHAAASAQGRRYPLPFVAEHGKAQPFATGVRARRQAGTQSLQPYSPVPSKKFRRRVKTAYGCSPSFNGRKQRRIHGQLIVRGCRSRIVCSEQELFVKSTTNRRFRRSGGPSALHP